VRTPSRVLNVNLTLSMNMRRMYCKWELRKLFREDQSEAAKMKQIVRMDKSGEYLDALTMKEITSRTLHARSLPANGIRGSCITSDALWDCRFKRCPPPQGFDHHARLVHVRPRQEYSISPRRRTLSRGRRSNANAVKEAGHWLYK
jgi:hypothetical protein